MIWTSRRLLDLAMSPIALYPYIRYRGYMDNESVIVALGALAQATRLDAFRLEVRDPPGEGPADAQDVHADAGLASFLSEYAILPNSLILIYNFSSF